MSGPREIKIGSYIDFPARSFNLLVREWYRQHARIGRSSGNSVGGNPTVKAINRTGVTLKYGDSVAIDDLALTDDGMQFRKPIFAARLNSDELTHSIMGVSIGSVEVPDGQPGTFLVNGVQWLQCTFSDAGHKFVQLPDVQALARAESSDSGFPILDSDTVPGGLPADVWVAAQIGGGGGGGGSSTSVDIDIVLIDKDIYIDPTDERDPPIPRGVKEDDPSSILDRDHVVLTEEEFANEVPVVFQDPPDDDYDANNVESLNLWGYERILLSLKYYRAPTKATIGSGTAASSTSDQIVLDADTASLFDDFYTGAKILITGGASEGEIRDITAYVGDIDLTATVEPDWPGFGPPDDTSTYEIFKPEPGYDDDPAKIKLNLATKSIDDGEDILESGTAQAGSTTTTIVLADAASDTNDTYNTRKIRIVNGTGEGEENTITDYVGLSRTATVSAWSGATPDDTSEYEIYRPARKIVQYDFMDVLYDDGKAFVREEYDRDSYPDYPENEIFPPNGAGTYAVLPDGFLKMRYRAIVINGVLMTELCKELPPPELPLNEDE